MPIRVTRVRWYTDWVRNVRYALRELWEAMFGCQHDYRTWRFRHVPRLRDEWGVWAVNKCAKCGKTKVFGWWGGPK